MPIAGAAIFINADVGKQFMKNCVILFGFTGKLVEHEREPWLRSFRNFPRQAQSLEHHVKSAGSTSPVSTNRNLQRNEKSPETLVDLVAEIDLTPRKVGPAVLTTAVWRVRITRGTTVAVACRKLHRLSLNIKIIR